MITNADGKIWLALKSRIDQWTETHVIDPDEKLFPNANTAFLIVTPVSIPFDAGIIGYNCGDEFRGFLSISPMVPIGWTYAQHAGLASRVCDHFAAGSKYTYQDAVVIIHARAKISTSPRLDAAWNRIDLDVPWRCFA